MSGVNCFNCKKPFEDGEKLYATAVGTLVGKSPEVEILDVWCVECEDKGVSLGGKCGHE